MNDAINPNHYKSRNGAQVIDLIRDMPFNIGNAIKYSYRNANKSNALEDLKKALWYLDDFQHHSIHRPTELTITQDTMHDIFEGLDEADRETCLLLTSAATSCEYDAFEDARTNLKERIHELS